jgi:lipopolysaccharide transport system ATP-binding protein
MSKIVLRATNISKQYRLGQLGTGTISHDLNRWWHKARGKEDPYLRIGDTNDRTAKGGSDYVWSLKDINFDVKEGDVLGIIGKNGAGKSTLLKILSQVTTATTGKVKIRGRIAALLEVGTGFHPELTGRENIFLNGAILGMTKPEIKSKFDEIVSFSGVEKYIDTPVKRYSSGMMVRLGFAVAAHLEPEILIVDEVLAVGDAEFQKKCLGKLKNVSGEGRTVIFVSHDMVAMKSLVKNCILLKNGQIDTISNNVSQLINQYLYGNESNNSNTSSSWADTNCKNEYISHLSSCIFNDNKVCTSNYFNDENIFIEIQVDILIPTESLVIAFTLKNNREQALLRAYFDDYTKDLIKEKGKYKIVFKIPKYTLAAGEYKICFDIAIHNYQKVSVDNSDLSFNVTAKTEIGNKFNFIDSNLSNSIIRPNYMENIIKI